MDALHRKILSLRYRGYDHEDIAHLLDISQDRVQRCLERAAAFSADEERITVVREAELAKLEEMEDAIFKFATRVSTDPDTGEEVLTRETIAAQAQVLKLMERRSNILGSDRAKDQTQHTHGLTLVQILADMSGSAQSLPAPKVVEHEPSDP